VPQDSFDLECDRLSHSVDGAQFERLRWERKEGPMLARLVALAHAALDSRTEFELAEEGASRDIKRFVLKIHGKRVLALTLRIESECAVADVHAIDRGSYSVADGDAATTDFGSADEAWMSGALHRLFGRVQASA
jgi:hypothetical protein